MLRAPVADVVLVLRVPVEDGVRVLGADAVVAAGVFDCLGRAVIGRVYVGQETGLGC